MHQASCCPLGLFLSITLNYKCAKFQIRIAICMVSSRIPLTSFSMLCIRYIFLQTFVAIFDLLTLELKSKVNMHVQMNH